MNELLNYLKEYLTPQTITVITTVILFLVALLKLVSMVITLNKQKAMTMDNLKSVLLGALKDQNKDEIENAINEVTAPIIKSVKEIMPYLQTFSKILALSQENTPTSRLAILELIEEMGKSNIQIEEIVQTAKDVVNEEVKIVEEKKQMTLEKLDEIIKPVE